MAESYWLLKAEPESRIVKGRDVKFSVDDFEAVTTSPWEGVRNYEARNIMKEMRVSDKALFYQSNCKIPGIAAFAEISRDAYPDHSAWDPEHPYYDPKSDEDNPRWFMVDVTFKSRAKHLVPLALLKYIAGLPSDELPEEVSYIGLEGCQAIRDTDLVTKGRLSVQRVSEKAWKAIQLLADNGGWSDSFVKKERVRKPRKKAVQYDKAEEPSEAAEDELDAEPAPGKESKNASKKRKRKAATADNGTEGEEKPTRRMATRARKN
ncbi:DUF55 domain containing protein [Amanita muscaria]